MITVAEIQEMFIRAAEIERADPQHVGPAQPRSLNLPYVHDWVDKLGWAKTKGDHLEEDKLEEERRIFWEKIGLRPTARELAELDGLRNLLLKVDDEGERRALLAWARAKAGGRAFSKWCFKVEGIHPETGRRRKNRAIAKIMGEVSRSDAQHSQKAEIRVLRQQADSDDKYDRIGEDARGEKRPTHWMDDTAFLPFIPDSPEADFSWAEKRNERRRQLRKKKQRDEQEY